MTFDEFKEEIKTVETQENCPVDNALELLSGKWDKFISPFVKTQFHIFLKTP